MRMPVLLSAVLLATSIAASAESKNPADYPLRIHIFGRSQTTFYHNRVQDEAKGDGRANLFEGGVPHAVDFSYDCDEKISPSFGYETYRAKWKKPGRELVVLMPVFGKSNSYFTCEFKTDVKTFAYASGNGRMNEEPVDRFKEWMLKHDYDPEHGKETPTNLRVDPASGREAQPQPQPEAQPQQPQPQR